MNIQDLEKFAKENCVYIEYELSTGRSLMCKVGDSSMATKVKLLI